MDREALTRREAIALAAASLGARAYAGTKPDFTIRIAETTVELARGHTVRTLAYNDCVPGPLLRMTEGKEITVEVVNQTSEPEMLHWHGFHIPPDVDGAHEEGTPMVQGRDHRLYTFTPRPSGTRWYHTHAMAGHNLKRGSYTGQFGMVIIEAPGDPTRYDLEVPIILHEWEPFFSSDMEMDVDYKLHSVNGRMLGSGDPIRVRNGQRVLFRFLNASATMPHRLALAGHTFQIIALDGNAVGKPSSVPLIHLAPGERVDAIVEMTNPGVWVLGELDGRQRRAGAGIVVEYGGRKGKGEWRDPAPFLWDYGLFGSETTAPAAVREIPVVIEPRSDGNLWAINGKSFPNTDVLRAQPGVRNRLVFQNRSTMAHPLHLHRHSLELVRLGGKWLSGVRKDVIMAPPHSTTEADLIADQPGPSLFHCHQQFHMDFGFMALLHYE